MLADKAYPILQIPPKEEIPPTPSVMLSHFTSDKNMVF